MGGRKNSLALAAVYLPSKLRGLLSDLWKATSNELQVWMLCDKPGAWPSPDSEEEKLFTACWDVALEKVLADGSDRVPLYEKVTLELNQQFMNWRTEVSAVAECFITTFFPQLDNKTLA